MRDLTKRAAVRKLLSKRKWQAESDRVIAREAGVGRFLVRSVRGELIAAGLIDPPPAQPSNGYTEEMAARCYRPGGVARGGYVFDDAGKTVRIDIWQKRQKAKKAAGPVKG